MKNSGKKAAYCHELIKQLYDDDDWVDEDQLRNKKKQKNKAKNRRLMSKTSKEN